VIGMGTHRLERGWATKPLRGIDLLSLRARLGAALAAAAAVPMLLVLSIYATQIESQAIDDAMQQQYVLAAVVAKNVADYVRLHQAAVAALAEQPGLSEMSRSSQERLLNGLATAYPASFNFATFGPNGQPIARSRGADLTVAPAHSLRPVGDREQTLLATRLSNLTGRPIIVFGSPVHDAAGTDVGLVTGELNSAELAEFLVQASAAPGAEIYLVDNRGHVIAHPDSKLVSSLADLSTRLPVAAMLSDRGTAGSLVYDASAGQRVAGYSKVPVLDWGVVVERPTEIVLAATEVKRQTALVALAVAALIAAAAGVLLAGRLTSSLAMLTRAAAAFAAGNSDVPLPRTSISEVSQLEAAFVQMRERLATRTRERDRFEDGLRTLNADLERRVDERTAQLEDANRELARSNGDLEQFAYAASHDLQEPLRVIASFSELLGKRYHGKLGGEADEFINYIVVGVTRMEQLIQALLAFARVGSRGTAPSLTDCGAVVDRALENLHAAVTESGAEIRHEGLPTVMADATQLTQVFQNLIGNAIKFRGPEPPKIEVGAACEEDGWRLWVRDDGIGIEEQHAERVFGIFHRLHTKDEYEGTGIGLALCRKIVERHGGRIWVTSKPGDGSTFSFTLPTLPPVLAGGAEA
jgi:signal transduction histidine kinase